MVLVKVNMMIKHHIMGQPISDKPICVLIILTTTRFAKDAPSNLEHRFCTLVDGEKDLTSHAVITKAISADYGGFRFVMGDPQSSRSWMTILALWGSPMNEPPHREVPFNPVAQG